MTATPPLPYLRRYAAFGLWANKTIGDYAVRRAAERQDATAFVDGAHVFGPNRDDASTDMADALMRHSLYVGDVVGMLLPNQSGAAVINLAVRLAGSSSWRAPRSNGMLKGQYMLTDSRCRAIFVADQFCGFLAP